VRAKFDIEIRIVDPVWAIEVQRYLLELLAKGLGAVCSVIDELENIFQTDLAVRCGRGVVYRTRTNVHGCSCRLGVQEKGVESRELFGCPFIKYFG
jgi:hypothetical protein